MSQDPHSNVCAQLLISFPRHNPFSHEISEVLFLWKLSHFPIFIHKSFPLQISLESFYKVVQKISRCDPDIESGFSTAFLYLLLRLREGGKFLAYLMISTSTGYYHY